MKQKLSRLTAVASLAYLIVGCTSTRIGDSARLERFEFSQPQMGVPFRIVLYATNAAAAQAAAGAAFARVSQLNEILSDYDTDSELNRLSRTAGEGQRVQLSHELWFVLNRSQEFAARTDGAFDVTVGPVVALWRRARREKKHPRPDLLASARAAVGWEKLRLDPRVHSAELLVPDMKLDLGGIAKGYALDEALAVLRTQGISRALITGGGDMIAGEPPPGQTGWRIEVAPLDAVNAPPARFARLRNAALATSGDLFQHVEIEGVRYSHIVNPRTGLGLTDHSLVTVIARDATTADALATAVSVLGPAAGLRVVESTPEAAVLITRQPGTLVEVVESRRFRRHGE